MKKITLLLMLLCFCFGYAQETFESGVPPTGWVKASRLNGATVTSGPGANAAWKANIAVYPAYEGAISAFIDSENIYSAVNNPTLPSTEEDWLISSQTAIPANGQLRFFVRQTILGDQNTIFKIMVSTTSQTDLSTFTQLKSFTEQELNDQDDNSVLEYDLRSADFPTALFGQNVYIAFVRQYTQTTTQRGGDRFLLDVVNVVQKCQPPTNLNVADITSTSANLTWTVPTGQANFQVVILPETDPFTETGSFPVTGATYAATGLTAGVCYKYYVRADCGNNNFSDWVGPLNFCTKPLGTYCNAPLVINGLPYQTTNNTSNFGNFFSTSQGTTCGATPAGTNFLAGNDVFYSYTPSSDCLTSVIMQATAGNSSVFVYSGCTNVGVACVAGAANTGTGVRNFTFNAVAGTQYIIVVSSAAATPTVGYTLTLQCIGCQATTAITGSATPASITTNSADLTWTNGGGAYTDYQVAIQTTQTLPTAASTVNNVTGNAYSATNLNAGTTYYFYVRGVCPGGDPTAGPFTQWYGPFAFSTKICDDADKCTYTFRLTDSANNGWNGARMEVRQNGFLIANTAGNTTIGQTYTSGAGPVDVTYQLCKSVPFTLEWTVAGTQPQQCIVTILNPFNQAIFVKPAGVGGAGQTVYTGVVDCENPRCDAPVMNVTATNITTNGATINWTNNPTPLPAGWSWDVYIYPTVGGTPPTAATIPTYDDITTFPFPTNIPLTPDTAYSVCVRVNCSPNPSEWSCGSFTTLPTCPKPTLQTVTAITTDAATLGWTPGTPTDNSWEVLLIPGCATPPPPPAVNPDLTGGALLFPTTAQPLVLPAGTLTPATIYYYYVRTVCPGNDKSTWTGPFAFNTLLCDAANKCNYKFLLTDTGGNGWNGGRIQVRQNCIVVATLGTQISGAGPTTVTVALCDDVPFDLFWSVAGTAPNEIGVTVQNPFVDNIYTYTPGTGTPLTSIYSGVAQCTPPTCPKPITLTTVSTSATTANVSWVETGTATQWEVYAIPTGTGAVPPVNGSPVSGVAPYYIANTNTNFQITGLTPSTRYTFYVRAICSSTDVSTWTIVSPGPTSPGTFITKPLNDECTAAVPVPVNPTRACGQSVTGNTLGGTLSPQSATCAGTEDDDVWYVFQATSSIHIITLSNVTISSGNLNHTVYSAGTTPDCTNMTQLYCSSGNPTTPPPTISVANNLVIGNYYYVRVFTAGTGITNSATFTICITTPPPITNDECSTAITATVNTGYECVNSNPGSVTGATGSTQANTCAGTDDDDVWFKFTANSIKQIISLSNAQGTTDDLNFAIYSGDCNGLVLKGCYLTNEEIIDNFVVGQVYYIRIWSAASTLQDITFDLCIGKIPPPIVTSTNQYTVQQLVEDVFIDSDCAIISNITSTNAGIGYFNKAQSEFTLDEGIVLSSGNVLAAPGPNTDFPGVQGNNNGLGADADLTALMNSISPGTVSNNVARLEFDFTPITSYISFDFIFASEEYGGFQCSFSDFFAFLLTNTATGVTENLAVVPGTNDPVSVYTVRKNTYNTACAAVNPNYFDKYYGTGIGSTIPAVAPVNFNGVTKPMVAAANVVPGVTYHMKIVLGDANDTNYDSAVFIQNFQVGDIDLGNDFTVANGNALCPGDSVTLNTNITNPADFTFEWSDAAGVIPGATGPTLAINQGGVYTVKATANGTSCSVTDSIIVQYYQDVLPGTPNNLVICSAATSGTFDLTQNTPVILAPFVTGTHTVTYFTSQQAAIDNVAGTAISTPDSYTGTNGQVIWVRVDNTAIGCKQIVSFTLTIQDLTPVYTLVGDTEICPNENTTITVTPTNNSFDTALATYTWVYGTTTLPVTGPVLNVTGSTGYGTYTVTVNNQGCTATQTFEITNSNTVWDLAITAPTELCPTQPSTISVAINNNPDNLPATYTFTLPDASTVSGTNNVLPITGPGTYNVSVDINGCVTTATVSILPTTTALPFTVNAPITLCPAEASTLTVNFTDAVAATTIYTFTMPDGTVVTGLNNTTAITGPGNYTVTVDEYGCTSTQVITVGLKTDAWVFTVDAPATLCPSQPATLTVNISTPTNGGTVTYTYTMPDGSVVTSASNTQAITGPGTYSVGVSVFGCVTTNTVVIAPSTDQVTVAIAAPATLCPNEPSSLTVNVTNNTSNGPLVYTYTLPDGSVVTNTSNVLAITGPGTYEVDVDVYECITTQSVVIAPSTPAWTFNVTGPAALCPSEAGTLTVNVTNNTANAPVVYTYTMPDGSFVVSPNNTLAVAMTGTYTVQVDIYGCQNTQTYTINTGNGDFQIAFAGAPYTICNGQSTLISFNALNFDINNPDAVYTWTRPDGTQANGPTITANQVGDYTLVVNILGCDSPPYIATVTENTSSVAVAVNGECEAGGYTIRATPQNGSFDPATSTFVWSGSPFIPTSDPSAILVKQSGSWQVSITTVDGCTTIANFTQNFVQCGIQKGLSPNNDGSNDEFDLSGYNVKHLTIYNRYGTEVYQYANYTNQWKGQSNVGDALPTATYFYAIETYDGQQITGWIYIIR